jgi:molecular chaperone GrpE
MSSGKDAGELKDRYLRQLADLENTRKRLQRYHDQLTKFAAEGLIRELLPVLDSLDQALVAVDPSTRPASAGLAQDSAPQTEDQMPGTSAGLRRQLDWDAVVKGVHLIHRQLLGLLHKQGVVRIPTVGERFDPHRHEAVAEVEADGTAPDTIVEEVQVGYTYHGRVIRPAIVKVAKRAADSTQHTADSTERNADNDQEKP